MKKATTMEKSSKDIAKTPLAVSRKMQQPIRQPTQVNPPKSGNSHVPVSNPRLTTTSVNAYQI